MRDAIIPALILAAILLLPALCGTLIGYSFGYPEANDLRFIMSVG